MINLKFFFKLNNKYFIYFSILIIFLFTFSLTCQAIGVRPLVVNLDMEPGEIKEFYLELSPEVTQQAVAFNLYHPSQLLSGKLSYEEGNLEQHPAIAWIDIQEQVTVPPGEKIIIKGTVQVPYGTKGSHTVVIMVEPLEALGGEGIVQFMIRYAVRVNINIDRPGLREKAEVSEFILQTNEEKNPVISAIIKNPSPLHYEASGEVTIRDKNKNLVERVPIISERARGTEKSKTTIYSGSKVKFSGEVTEALSAGNYDLQLSLQYADGRKLIKRKTIEVGNEFIDLENMDYIKIYPNSIREEIRRGGVYTQPLEISNRTGEEILIEIENQKVASNYQRSLLDNFVVELRGNQQVAIEGRRSERPVLIVRAPREEIAAGGYYDSLEITVFDPESKEEVQKKTIDLAFVVGENFDYAAEVQEIQVRRINRELFFSTIVLNKGDIHFTPQARVYLKQNEEIKETINLQLPETEEYILPERSGLLNAYTQNIETGKYTAEVTIFNEGEEITVKEFEIEIAPLEGV